jgi:nucleoid-associated protein YgaU
MLAAGVCAALPFAKTIDPLPPPQPVDEPVAKLELPSIAVEAPDATQTFTQESPAATVASWHQPTPIVLPPDGAPLPSLPRAPIIRDTASRIHEPDFSTPVTSEPPLPPRLQVRRKHRIADGDSLELIALRYLGDKNRGAEIAALNRDVISSPGLLPVGKEIVIPAE